jgi:hypothetical protein
MKTLRFMLALLAIASVAHAQDVPPVKLGDITLTDGRLYKGAAFVSETPTHITVRYEGGIAKLDKAKLPEAMQARYPVDQAAAAREKAEEETRKAMIEADRRKLRAYEQAQAAKIAREQQKAATINNAQIRSEEARAASVEDRARHAAQQGAENYFRTTWRPGNNAVRVTDLVVTLENFAAKPGWPGHWTFDGEGYVEFYISQGRSFTSNRVRFIGELENGRCKITPR